MLSLRARLRYVRLFVAVEVEGVVAAFALGSDGPLVIQVAAQGEDLACLAEGIDAVGDAIVRGPNSDGCEF